MTFSFVHAADFFFIRYISVEYKSKKTAFLQKSQKRTSQFKFISIGNTGKQLRLKTICDEHNNIINE